MSAEIADELRACAARIDADGTASQIVSADELRELAAMAEAGGWQPIETAPKDWTDVLLFDPEYKNDHRKVFEGYYPPKDSRFGYWVDAAYNDRVNPTHWQPLPAPPSSLPNKEDRNG